MLGTGVTAQCWALGSLPSVGEWGHRPALGTGVTAQWSTALVRGALAGEQAHRGLSLTPAPWNPFPPSSLSSLPGPLPPPCDPAGASVALTSSSQKGAQRERCLSQLGQGRGSS